MFEDRKTSIETAFTHGGVFHADDVFSAALLRILNPDIRIERGFAVPDDYSGIVFDIGYGEFDHHQARSRVRENGIPYAAFGLLWERFGSCILEPHEAEAFDEQFIQPIDLADNTGRKHPICQLVSDFNPNATASPDAFDSAFEDAVTWAASILIRRLNSIALERKDYNYVRQRMEVCDGAVLVLERPAKWQTAAVGSGYDYVVYPSQRGGYNVQAVPGGNGESNVNATFPTRWRGSSATELQGLSGISGLSFCHPSGYLCAVESFDDAIAITNMLLDHERR